METEQQFVKIFKTSTVNNKVKIKFSFEGKLEEKPEICKYFHKLTL